MQDLEQKDVREIVGFPRSPLPKIAKNDRATLKKNLQNQDFRVESPIGLRMALCAGVPIRAEWLNAHVIDLALDSNDIAKNFEKLIVAQKLIDAAPVLEVLIRKLDRTPAAVLRALRKAIVPAEKVKKPSAPVIPNGETAALLLQTAMLLASLLLHGELNEKKKRFAAELLELVWQVTKVSPLPDVLVSGLDFLRLLEKHIGWAELERESMSGMRSEILAAPAKVIGSLLTKGCIGDASILFERVKLFDGAQEQFTSAIEALARSGKNLPLASRTWIDGLFRGLHKNSASQVWAATDATFERLALVLINAWESREDGGNAQHAFLVAEEVFRNGFGLYLGGQIGSIMSFDPDIHETQTNISYGDQCRLLRPWVEWRSSEGLKIMMRGRVARNI